MATSPFHVIFAGGGTGGHLFPGVAVARELRRRHTQIQIVFVGAGKTLETRVVSKERFQLERIRTGGLVRKSLGGFVRGLALIPVGIYDSAGLIRRLAPRLVVGLGGYSSGPVVLWAALRGCPTMLLEQNTVPGMTNRLLGRVVHAAALSYEASLPYFASTGFISGNPVRAGFFGVPKPEYAPDIVHVLVVGGSQGAHAINLAMVRAAPTIAASSRLIRVTHQSGELDVALVRRGYNAVGLHSRVEPFFEEMDREMATADLIVCRAGAMTLAEVAAVGRPAIIVPFPHASHDHQHRNAVTVAGAGAAVMINQSELRGQDLGALIVSLAVDDSRRSSLADASGSLASPNAAGVIVDRMERLLALEEQTRATKIGVSDHDQSCL